MANWRLRFGSYDLPVGFHPVGLEGAEDIAAQELPRMPGAVTQTGRIRPKIITIAGGWGGDTLTDWDTALDAIMANLTGTGDLWLGRDDRFFKDAQYLNHALSTPADGRLWGRMGLLSITFQAARFPVSFDSASNTPTLSNTGGTVNYDSAKGSSDTWPVWTITVNASGTGAINLANTTTGESCTIQNPAGNFASSDVIALCGLPGAQVATLNGVTTPGLFTRRIPRLQPGNNTITLSDSGTLTITSLTCAYPGRWR